MASLSFGISVPRLKKTFPACPCGFLKDSEFLQEEEKGGD